MERKKYLIIWQNSDNDEINVRTTFSTETTLDEIVASLVEKEVKKNKAELEDWWTCKYSERGEYDPCVGVIQYCESHTNYWAMELDRIQNVGRIRLTK